MKKSLIGTLLVLITFILVACGGSNNSDLIGTWEREHDFGTTIMTFSEDETGTWTISGLSNEADFEWSTNNGTLTKEFLDIDEIEAFEYRIDGNNLIIIEDGNEFVYTRVD